MSFYTGRWIKATRKPHCCDWCAQRIEKGSRAFYSAGVWEGDFFAGHRHQECHHAQNHANRDDLMNGWMPGDYARGRTDDDFDAPPMFDADGNKLTPAQPNHPQGAKCAAPADPKTL